MIKVAYIEYDDQKNFSKQLVLNLDYIYWQLGDSHSILQDERRDDRKMSPYVTFGSVQAAAGNEKHSASQKNQEGSSSFGIYGEGLES